METGRHAPLRIGLLGVGTVGTAFADMLRTRSDMVLAKALVRDPAKPRRIAHPDDVLTTDVDEVLGASDLIVELMGGTGAAVSAAQEALARNLPVVSANKAALAERWEVYAPAMRSGRLYVEASVMAGTPVVGPISGALRGSSPHEVHAVLNGTCSYVLSRLEQGSSYADALGEAQRLGYAEADPSLDVSGLDAAHKLTILARLSVDPELTWEHVRDRTHGIELLTPGIVHEAMEDGGRLQLVGSIVPGEAGWTARVRPVYLPAGHRLAGGDDVQASLVYRGVGGEVLLAGPGAGGAQTASAVLGDVLAAAAGRPGPAPLDRPAPLPVGVPLEDLGELEPA